MAKTHRQNGARPVCVRLSFHSEQENERRKFQSAHEKVDLELSSAERKLLLTGLVFVMDRVEKAIRSTPAGKPVAISIGDLDDLAGHVAGEANHAKNARTEEILSGLYEKVDGLLEFYARE